MEEEKVVEESVPDEQVAPPSRRDYTVKATEPGGPGEGRPTPPPESPKEDKK